MTITNNGATVNNNGKIGKCYSFDGSDDFIKLEGACLTSIFTGTTQPFSVCMWVYNGETAANRAILFGNYIVSPATSSAFFNIELASSSNQIRYDWKANPDWVAGATTVIPTNTWTHICCSYDGAKEYVYINGELQATRTGVLPAMGLSSGVIYYLGRDSRTGATSFLGRMNDFRIYDNCLSDFEVKEIAKGLILHWPLTKAPETLLHTYYTALPNEYQEVEYLESNGTQYINTGFVANEYPLELDAIMCWTAGFNATGEKDFWGNYSSNISSTSQVFVCGKSSAASAWYQWGGSSWVPLTNANLKLYDKQFTRFIYNGTSGRKAYINGVQYTSSISNNSMISQTTNPIGLFSGAGNRAYCAASVRIYKASIISNNVMVRKFIPCYRKNDNKPGMYDLINGTFYINAGTGEFICGPLIKSIPNTYLPLEYIESTGTQEIRNNIAIAANSILKTAVMATQEVTSERSFVGASSSFEWYFKNSQIQIWKNAAVASTTYPINAQINTKYELTMKNTAAESNVSLFGYNGSSYRFIGRMYYFITTNSSGLTTHDMRPALRVSDKKPGMYDLVTDTFYVNAGSGDFTYPAYTIEYDISGYHHDGTVLNSPAAEFDTVRYKNILHINATNQKVKATGITTSGFQNSYTIAWWANFASGQSAAMHWGFSAGTRLNGLYNNGNLWNTGDGSSNPLYAPGTTTQLASNASLAGQWHHWAMTGNGTKCYLYKDGELYGEAKTYKALNCSNVDFYINGWDSGTTYCSSNSKFSDLRIYATALSAVEVKELYDMGKIN